MFAFLFNARHEDLQDEMIYGPLCTSRVIAAIEAITPVPATQIIRGEIVFGFLVYNIAEVSTGPSDLPSGSKVTTISYEGNNQLNLTLICDLAETFSQSPSTVSEDDVMLRLARDVIWCIVTPNLTSNQALEVDKHIAGFGPYMGMAALDPGNPTHRDIMLQNMVGDVYLDNAGIHYLIETGLDEADINEADWIARSFGSSNGTFLEEYEQYKAGEPQFSLPDENSPRGELSRKRVSGHLVDTHCQKAARAILEYYESVPKDKSFTFVASSSLPNDFLVEEKKLTEYLLNLDHPKGGPKARFFIDTLGIGPHDWRYLADQLSEGAAKARLYRVEATQYGYSHGAFVAVTGRNGKVAAVETGWQIPEAGPARLITAYPAEGSILAELEASASTIVPPELEGNERWQAIYDIAHAKGVEAAASKVPTPMVLEKYGTIWDGMCGFAWVQFTDARQPFPKWLLDKDLASRTSPGARMYARLQEQSVDKNSAYADAFAKVLRANGISCTSESRLD